LIELTRLLTISATFSCDPVAGVAYEKVVESKVIAYVELYATVLIETKAYGV
jgi:hypothetical protein